MIDISVPSASWAEMERRREHIVALRGGTIAMREAAERWLPRFPRELSADYQRRLASSFLYEAVPDTISKLASKPFSKPMRLLGELPEIMVPIEGNADRSGTPLHNIAQASFEDAVAYGMSALFVDAPKLTGGESLQFVRANRIYPAITMVSARDIIYSRSAVGRDGMRELREVRIREWRDEYDSEVSPYQVRVLKSADAAGGSLATWELWDHSGDGWFLADSGTISHRKIPLVPWYTKKCGFMRAHSPLEGLGWLNIAHYQSSSDQRNILQFARVAQPFATGVTTEEEERLRESGGNRLITLKAPDAKVGFLEHSGAAIEAGERDLQALERRMETLGLQPFIERVAESTATGVMANQSGTMTLIQRWIRDCEAGVLSALVFAHEIMGAAVAPIDPELRVEIFSDFTTPAGSKDGFAAVDKLRARGDIDHRTTLEEAQRYSIIAENRNLDEIIERAEEERSKLAFTMPIGMPSTTSDSTTAAATGDPAHDAATGGSTDLPNPDQSQAA